MIRMTRIRQRLGRLLTRPNFCGPDGPTLLMPPFEPTDPTGPLVGSGSTNDFPTNPSFNGSRKRLASGSRGTASLTPDQLAKKRANDRESQRAIRERTKLQIESLEREITKLKSQKPYQDLQLVVQQKEAVEAEVVDLKRRLASVLHIIKPLVAGFEHGSCSLLPCN